MRHEDLYVIPDFFTSSHKHSPAAVINVIVLQITTQHTVSQQSTVQCQVQRKTQWDEAIFFPSHSLTTVRYHLLQPKFTSTNLLMSYILSSTVFIIISNEMESEHPFCMYYRTRSHSFSDSKRQTDSSTNSSKQIRYYHVKLRIKMQSYVV